MIIVEVMAIFIKNNMETHPWKIKVPGNGDVGAWLKCPLFIYTMLLLLFEVCVHSRWNIIHVVMV